MILIGMFDSPFVRRVAVSMNLLGMGFEHRNWVRGSGLRADPAVQSPGSGSDPGAARRRSTDRNPMLFWIFWMSAQVPNGR